jgi:hypothetical protein
MRFTMSEQTKARLDDFIERLLSRKLLVWLTSTGFLIADKMTSDEWVAIALAYIGIQGIADIAAKWKHGR